MAPEAETKASHYSRLEKLLDNNMKNLKILLFIGLLLLSVSCMNNTKEPVGPTVDIEDPFYQNFEIIGEEWISDFDGTQGIPSSRIQTDDVFIYTVPIIYQSSESTYPFGSDTITAIWTNEIEAQSTNYYMKYYYEFHAPQSGEDLWINIRLFWINGTVDLNEYGNGIAFKARGDGQLEVKFSGDVYKTVDLSKNWQEYILLFEDFEGMTEFSDDITRCEYINMTPPKNAGTSGFVNFDDVRLVYYSRKR